MSDIAVSVENLSKSYLLGHNSSKTERNITFREVIARNANNFVRKTRDMIQGRAIIQGDEIEEFWALNNVSFNIKQGDRVGIIGRNGAGKSTLLKILSRITEPTHGRVTINGRVSSLLEVGTGFHPELSGRENIFLNGAILGMSRKEIQRKFDEIVEFSEVEKFLDTPVKRYSSGMYVRLAFGVAAHLEPEILIVDEVLAVGDAQFQKKCLGKMKDVANGGRTVIFVSHNVSAIRELCTTAILMNNGTVESIGAPVDLISKYINSIDKSRGNAVVLFAEDLKKIFQLHSARLVNDDNIEANVFCCDDNINIDLVCHVRQNISDIIGYMTISRFGDVILESDSQDLQCNQLANIKTGCLSLKIKIPPRSLGVGDYQIYLNFTRAVGGSSDNIDSPGVILSFRLNDQNTLRGNGRNGCLSTLLTWQVTANT